MGLGLSKGFIIAAILAIGLGYLTKNAWNGFVLMLIYACIVIVFRILTK